MTLGSLNEKKFFRPLIGAALGVFCGLFLWDTTPGELWTRASYDYLYHFRSPAVTNRVVLILMDNEAFAQLGQSREAPWDRAQHAKLLNKLADDGCPLVGFDVRLMKPRNADSDQSLVRALHRLNHIVLAADQIGGHVPGVDSAAPVLPIEPFLSAARTTWGVAYLDPDKSDQVVRRHWPFPSPAPYQNMVGAMAELSGANLSAEPTEKWIRYYGKGDPCIKLSYDIALNKPPFYFRDKTVFVGNEPRNSLPSDEIDKFLPPSGEATGGVEILATCYMNLVNGDWLRRPGWLVEEGILVATGLLCGAGFCFLRRGALVGLAVGISLLISIGVVLVYYYSNYWFPWLIVAGGQIPCCAAWALWSPPPEKVAVQIEKTEVMPAKNKTIVLKFAEDTGPVIPDYELVEPPFGKGGFGKVWLCRNAIGQWQALKVIYQSKFGDDARPYDAEFNGLQRYKPVSEKHAGLLRVELVSRKRVEGYFYYVMELGDSRNPGWEKDPALYKPVDLENLRKNSEGHRLPPAQCLDICVGLAEALDYLHREGLIHRDIKPSNVIFVKGRPKLADVGLVAHVRPLDQVQTLVGTMGYMPPPPERTGTVQSDIYALGMLLYVISTGTDPQYFPELSTTLMERSGHQEFMRLNAIIRKACQPDCALRYQTVAEMLNDLREAANVLPLR